MPLPHPTAYRHFFNHTPPLFSPPLSDRNIDTIGVRTRTIFVQVALYIQREREREKARERGRKREREGGREGDREGWREGGREGGRK